MSKEIHRCQCPLCQQEESHPDQLHHRQINLLMSSLNEQQRRWYAALESLKIGHGGIELMTLITGVGQKTIWRGRKELEAELEGRPMDRIRVEGGGRPTVKKSPEIVDDLKAAIEEFTAGDPMQEACKWVRFSLRKLCLEMAELGHCISPMTAGRLLRENNYSLRANVKSKEPGSNHADRNTQFEYIEQKKKEFKEMGLPIISVDAKKKELIGNFKNAGRTWGKEAEQVNGHDFSSQSDGKATPYGIYDVIRNCGTVCVGKSADTPEFVVDAIIYWWETEGKAGYAGADQLLILADAGGSNGARPRMWKKQLQIELANRLGITVTVCHYPTGCSKYNPIEHKMFSHISSNWAGVPLRTFETALNYIRGTVTTTGLKIKAYLNEKIYEKGLKVTNVEMKALNLVRSKVCPQWNYTIYPADVSI